MENRDRMVHPIQVKLVSGADLLAVMYISHESISYNSARTISVGGRQMLIGRVDDDDNTWEREGESDRKPKAPGSGTEDVAVGCHGSVILSAVGCITSIGDAATVPSLLLWVLFRFWIWRSSGSWAERLLSSIASSCSTRLFRAFRWPFFGPRVPRGVTSHTISVSWQTPHCGCCPSQRSLRRRHSSHAGPGRWRPRVMLSDIASVSILNEMNMNLEVTEFLFFLFSPLLR